MSRLSQAVSVVCTGAFAGGCLVVSVVLVPTWREMDPEAFLDWFPKNGPRLGLTLFPLETAGALFAVLALFGTVRRRSNDRLPWGLSSLCIVTTLVLLPAYFAGANARMIEGNMGAREVDAELASWRGWQWLRTALAVLAVAFGGWGLGREQAERTPKASKRESISSSANWLRLR